MNSTKIKNIAVAGLMIAMISLASASAAVVIQLLGSADVNVVQDESGTIIISLSGFINDTRFSTDQQYLRSNDSLGYLRLASFTSRIHRGDSDGQGRISVYPHGMNMKADFFPTSSYGEINISPENVNYTYMQYYDGSAGVAHTFTLDPVGYKFNELTASGNSSLCIDAAGYIYRASTCA